MYMSEIKLYLSVLKMLFSRINRLKSLCSALRAEFTIHRLRLRVENLVRSVKVVCFAEIKPPLLNYT